MDSKAKQVHADIKQNNPPSDKYTDAMVQYHAFRSTGQCDDVDCMAAFKIYKDKLQREIVESLLFGDADFTEVEAAFGVPKKALSIYEEMFFDRAFFQNKLDRLSYLETCKDKLGKELKLRSMNLGPEFVLYTYANIVPKTEQQRKLVQRMFMATSYKAMSINYNSMDSKVTKNALEHAKLMIKAWEALQKFSEEEITDDMDLIKIVTKGTESIDISIQTTDII